MTAAFPIFLMAVITAGMAVSVLVVAEIIGPRRAGAVKEMPYESGMDPISDARQRFNISFYLLAIEFLVFDVEVLILFPWAVSASGGELGRGAFLVAMAFLAILVVGFAYTWRKGAFKWH